MQVICDKAVRDDPSSLQYVPDWFVTREGVDMWHGDYYDDDGNHWDDNDNEGKFFEWYDGYKKQKAQKASIKRVNTDCLASIKTLGLVYVRRRKKRNRKIMEVNIGLFVSGDQNFLTQKEQQNKDESFSSEFGCRIIQV